MNKPQVTVCIPVGQYHTDVYQRAISSVEKQTVPALAYHAIDKGSIGAGAMRNYLLGFVDTPYVVFLDADDWIAPDFVEQCLERYEEGHYIYTDWFQGGQYVHASSKPWCGGTWHVITALLKTEDARNVGGFNEDMPALEDTEFYLKLTTDGNVCGLHVERPLVYYTVDGHRALNAHRSGDLVEQLKANLMKTYGGRMGCCGDPKPLGNVTVGERQPGDVLAMALWHGNRPQMGMATGRAYPRLSYPRTTWVDPRDIQASPHLWRVEPDAPTLSQTPRLEGAAGLGEYMKETGHFPAPHVEPTIAPQRVIDLTEKPKPDVSHVVEVARKRL